jgi:hypothetical protein
MKERLPHFRKGDVLVRRVLHTALGKTFTLPSDQITLLEDTNPAEAERVRTPAEGTLLIWTEYIGSREKINGRWVVPVKRGQMDNSDILRNYVLKGGQPSLI